MPHKFTHGSVSTKDGTFATYEIRNNDGKLLFAVYGPMGAIAVESACLEVINKNGPKRVTVNDIFQRFKRAV